MNKKMRRLAVNRETIRSLSGKQLVGVHGGSAAGCPLTIGAMCLTQNCSALCTGGGGGGGSGSGGSGQQTDCGCTVKTQ